MAQPIRVRNPRGEFVEAKKVSASNAKNVGRILDYVAKDGGVTITRRNEPLAVVIPVETYARLAASEQASLDTLTREFDALLERMQQPHMSTAMQRAFQMTPADLGGAAARQANQKQPVKASRALMKRTATRKQRGGA